MPPVRRPPTRLLIEPIHLHVHVHYEFPESVTGKLDQLLTQGARILMAAADLKAALTKIDVATDNIAADLVRLKALIVPGITDAEVAEIQALLDASVAKLEGIAASTDDPVPNP